MKSIGCFLILTIVFFYSCDSESTKLEIELDGDWIYVEDSLNYLSNSELGIRFENNTIFSISNAGYFENGRYTLVNDTIRLLDRNIQYIVFGSSKDSLVLIINEKLYKYYNRNLEFNSNIKLDKISLNTDLCYGKCPVFCVTIEENGNITFFGKENTQVNGLINYKASADFVSKLDSLLKWSYIEKLDTSLSYHSIDGWGMNLKISYNGKVKVVNGSYGNIPFRLQPLVWQILKELKSKKLLRSE